MTDLADKTCVPCRGDVPPLEGAELEELSRQVPGWEVVDEHHLRRDRLGPGRGHDLHPQDRRLTESDFVLAAKVDRL